MLSLDDARARHGRHAHDYNATAAAMAEVEQAMERVLAAGGEVTLDATSTVAAHRAHWLGIARRHHARAIAVVVETPLELAQGRNARRARPVPAEVVERMWHEARQLTDADLRGEGFAAVYRVPGTQLARSVPEMQRDMKLYYGVWVSFIGEHGDTLALGHREPRRVVAAFNKLARREWGVPFTAEDYPTVAASLLRMYARLAADCDAEIEGAGWSIDLIEHPAHDAFPVTVWCN